MNTWWIMKWMKYINQIWLILKYLSPWRCCSSHWLRSAWAGRYGTLWMWFWRWGWLVQSLYGRRWINSYGYENNLALHPINPVPLHSTILPVYRLAEWRQGGGSRYQWRVYHQRLLFRIERHSARGWYYYPLVWIGKGWSSGYRPEISYIVLLLQSKEDQRDARLCCALLW